MVVYFAALDPMTLVRALPGNVAQGIIWGIMALGVYITFRILDFADLTVDGSLATGGAVAVMLIRGGMNPALALVFAFLAGMAAGFITGMLHTALGIPGILASILTQIALWSINLRIMGGKSNVPLLKAQTIFSEVVKATGLTQSQVSLIVGLIIAALMIVFLYWLFGTEIGAALRATGNNEAMIRALGVDTRKTKMIALMLSNGLVAVSGALVCQSQKFGDINMGTGAIVIGLASIVIGEVLLGRLRSFGSRLISAVVGSVVYFLIVLQLGMDANDMKLLSAVIVALALCVPVAINKWKIRSAYKEGGSDNA